MAWRGAVSFKQKAAASELDFDSGKDPVWQSAKSGSLGLTGSLETYWWLAAIKREEPVRAVGFLKLDVWA
jgi:hypothetical protein